MPRPDLLKGLLRSAAEPKVALISNAQDPYPSEIAKKRSAHVSELFALLGFVPTTLDLREYVGKVAALAEELKKYHLIWCAGGNAFSLRYEMKASGFDTVIKDILATGIVYGGWSAGGVVAGPSLYPIEVMDDQRKAPAVVWEGLGLTEYFVWPHWDTDKYVPLQAEASERIKALPYEVVILKDGQVLIDENGHRQIVQQSPL